MRNLELECHYLSQALVKLKKNSPEWTFLHQKLEAAEEEFESMQHQDETGPASSYATPTPSSPYEDDVDQHHDHRYSDKLNGTEEYGDRSSFIDDGSYEPVVRENNHSRGWSSPRKKRLVACSILVAVAVLIPCILLFTSKNKGQSSNSIADENDGYAATLNDGSAEITEPCASFSMHLIPDQFGNETSWKLARYDGVELENIHEVQMSQGRVILRGGPYEYKKAFDTEAIGSHYEMIHATTCLPTGVYAFILHDAREDGICCSYGQGEYGLDLSKGRVIRPLSPGKFSGAVQFTPFEVTADDIDVLPATYSSAGTVANHDISDVVTPSSDTPCSSSSLHLVLDQVSEDAI